MVHLEYQRIESYVLHECPNYFDSDVSESTFVMNDELDKLQFSLIH